MTRRPFQSPLQFGQRVARRGILAVENLRGLGDIFTDLLGRQTKRTNLGGEGRRGTNLTTRGPQVDNLDLIGIELGTASARALAME